MAHLFKAKKKPTYSKQPPLPISLQLNGNTLSFRTDLQPGGKWKTETDSTAQDEQIITKLQHELTRMHKDRKQLEDEKLAVLEEKYFLEFKNQLLLEMVAVSQLDAKKNVEELQREKLKTEALKWELATTCLLLTLLLYWAFLHGKQMRAIALPRDSTSC